MTATPAAPPPGDEDPTPEVASVDLELARGLLLLLADTHPDAIRALVPEVALFHLDETHPPPAPAVPAETELRGEPLHDEAVSALIHLVEAAEDPGLRGRAMKALHEMTTPIHFAHDPAPAPAEAVRRDRGERG